jgi:copper chaperone NosL
MAVTRRRFLYTAAGLAGVVAAPAIWTLLAQGPAETGPPLIRYGQDRCDVCGMIISDPRYAAGVRRGGSTHRFDDIGCFVKHSGAAVMTGQAAGYVHDAGTHEWVEARAAVFVRSPAIRTPMGFGVAAYAGVEPARRAHSGAATLTLEALLASLAKEPS